LNYFHKIKNIIKDDFYESPEWEPRKKSIISALASKRIKYSNEKFDYDALNNIDKVTANIIAALHEKDCSVNNRTSYKTVYNLYIEAKKNWEIPT